MSRPVVPEHKTYTETGRVDGRIYKSGNFSLSVDAMYGEEPEVNITTLNGTVVLPLSQLIAMNMKLKETGYPIEGVD